MSELGVIDLGDEAYWADIHAVLRPLREAAPLARSTAADYEVLRYEHGERLLRDPAHTTALQSMLANQGITGGPLHEWWSLIMNNHDGAEHTRIRTLIGHAFTPRQAEKLRNDMRAAADRILDGLPIGEEVDLLKTYCHEYPLAVMCDALGVPQSDQRLVERWTGTVGIAFSPVIPPETLTQIDDAVVEFNEYSSDLIERCRANPGDNLLSDLVHAEEAGDRLSRAELQALIINLLIGGHDTGKSMLSIILWLLATNPDELARLRAEPGLLRSTVEEAARYETPIGAVPRILGCDVKIEDTVIPAGSFISISVPAANRDPRQFADPERFDIGRSENRHLSFSWGAHHCVGANLARVELQEATAAIVERFDLVPAIDAVSWVPFAAVRRFEALPARLEPHAS